MKRTIFNLVLPLAAMGPAAAMAQGSEPFSGPYVGPELGLHEHHFYIRETDAVTGVSQGRYYRAWGVGGGVFAGYDLPLAERVRLGVEASLSIGGATAEAHFDDGGFYRQNPRYGAKVTARLGYVLGEDVLVYGTAGYGGHRYRVEQSGEILGATDWGDSFTLGAGVELRLGDRAGLRLDLRHLDNQMNQVLVGIPVRF
jgi:outer membrane immunogenic protein